MNRAPILSVIIVTYESRNEIVACLRVLPTQLLGEPIEVIVLDNASSDGTAAIVAQEFPQFLLLKSPANLGFSRANNLAFTRSCGRSVLFLNPDTISNGAALTSCLSRLMDEPEIGIISPRLTMAGGELDLACRRSIPSAWDGFTRASGLARWFPKTKLFAGYNLTYLPDDATYDVGAVNGAFMMTRRSVLEAIGLFDERFFMYGDDLDLCYRCRQAGYRVVFDGRVSIIHLKGQSSAKNYQALSKQLFVGTEQFYLKHFNPRDSAFVRWKYRILFWLWQTFSSLVGSLKGHKHARPV